MEEIYATGRRTHESYEHILRALRQNIVDFLSVQPT